MRGFGMALLAALLAGCAKPADDSLQGYILIGLLQVTVTAIGLRFYKRTLD